MIHAFTQSLAFISQKDCSSKAINDVILLLREVIEVINNLSRNTPQTLGGQNNGSNNLRNVVARPRNLLTFCYNNILFF